MNRPAPLFTLSFLLTGSLAACVSEQPLRPPSTDLDVDEADRSASVGDADPLSDEYRPLVGALPVQNGALDGSIGAVEGLARDSEYETSGWGEARYASIYTVGAGTNGAAMTILEIEGGLNHASLTPGARLEHDLYEQPREAPSLFAYVVGCAGEEPSAWDFDQVADHTSVVVSAHPDDADVLILDYEARFTDWDTGEPSSVVGRVEVVRTPR